MSFFHTVVKKSDRWVVDLIEVDNSVVNNVSKKKYVGTIGPLGPRYSKTIHNYVIIDRQKKNDVLKRTACESN